MNNNFFFFEAGFRSDAAWTSLKRTLAGVCEANGGLFIAERSNAEILRGIYREEDIKRVMVYNLEGESSIMEFISYSNCEFLLARKAKLLLVKNPTRGALKSLIARLEDATNFQIYVEPKMWDLWEKISAFEIDRSDISFLRVDIADYRFPGGMQGQLALSGALNLATLAPFKAGRILRIEGFQDTTSRTRFALQQNGVFRISANVGFEFAMSFVGE